ncbi:MAG: hypothetical protein KA140_00770 [Caldisericia bacterium]|nr:hypothetical protein [Caldisericia bacterium]
MELENILEELQLELSDFYASAIVGLDGLTIAEIKSDDNVDINGASAEFASVINSMSKTSEYFDSGLVQGMLISTEKYNFLTQAVGNLPFFILVVLGNTGNIGKARYLMGKLSKVVMEMVQ